MVEKLGLKLQRHPHPYQWLNESGDIKIGYKVKVLFKIGVYVDTVECDVAPMSVCHLLLGRPGNMTVILIFVEEQISTH
jgi:hypothetical protein